MTNSVDGGVSRLEVLGSIVASALTAFTVVFCEKSDECVSPSFCLLY